MSCTLLLSWIVCPKRRLCAELCDWLGGPCCHLLISDKSVLCPLQCCARTAGLRTHSCVVFVGSTFCRKLHCLLTCLACRSRIFFFFSGTVLPYLISSSLSRRKKRKRSRAGEDWGREKKKRSDRSCLCATVQKRQLCAPVFGAGC